MNLKRTMAIFGVSTIIVVALGVWSVQAINEGKPDTDSFAPRLIFDSQEQYYPMSASLADWNPAEWEEEYEKTMDYVTYKKRVDTENYTVFEFFYFFAYNEYANIHETDVEACYVWVQDREPTIMGLEAHGNFEFYSVSSKKDLIAYVARGAHGFFPTQEKAFPNDGLGKVLDPSDFQMEPYQKIVEHENQMADNLLMYGDVGSGILLPHGKDWWYMDEPSKLIENKEIRDKISGASLVPLSAGDSLPSTHSLTINAMWILPLSLLGGFIIYRNGLLVISILSVLAVIAVLTASWMTYGATPTIASQVLHTVPFSLIALLSAFIGTGSRFVWESRIEPIVKAVKGATFSSVAGLYAGWMFTDVSWTIPVFWTLGIVGFGLVWRKL